MKEQQRGFVKLGFLAAAIYLLVHNHPIAGGWCIAGALLVGYSSSNKDDGE